MGTEVVSNVCQTEKKWHNLSTFGQSARHELENLIVSVYTSIYINNLNVSSHCNILDDHIRKYAEYVF